MALIIVHPFWPTSSLSSYVSPIEGTNYLNSLVALCNAQKHVALFETQESDLRTKYILATAGVSKQLHTIYTKPNSSVLLDERCEDQWLSTFAREQLLCTGGCFAVFDEGTQNERFAECLGSTMMRLARKGYDCQLQRQAAYSLESIRDDPCPDEAIRLSAPVRYD